MIKTYKCSKCGMITSDDRLPSPIEGGSCGNTRMHSWRQLS